MRTSARDRGFTLIELLVVIIVVGILAAIAIPIFLNQRDKASAGATKQNLRNLIPVIITARENAQQHLLQIDGSNCSVCFCRTDAAAMLPVADPGFPASTCGTRWLAMTQGISTASGEPLDSTRRLFTDGWGYPILVDENEAENAAKPCGIGIDSLWSGGANHTLLTAAAGGLEPDDVTRSVPPGGLC